MMPKLKICGVNDAGFAAEAARRGVDYIGLIFVAKSPRCVALGDAKAIRAAAVRAVAGGKKPRFAGVFADASRREIARIADEVPLDVVQLHGAYGDGDVESLKARGLEVWRLHPHEGNVADAVLVDGCDGGRSGGTGRLADWSLVGELKRCGFRVVLAGGLSSGNLAIAAKTGADVLDVNSSLETSPGVKSMHLLDELLHIARTIATSVADF